jgi:hypothetical protein
LGRWYQLLFSFGESFLCAAADTHHGRDETHRTLLGFPRLSFLTTFFAKNKNAMVAKKYK